jgi:putative SOS response-associated peptidase YedK
MCFSAIAFQDMLRLGKDFDALVDSEAFARLYGQRLRAGGPKTPKAMDDAAIRMGGEVASMVKEWRLQQSAEFEQELFKQAKRLADAERTLQTKETKKALNDQRIASTKVDQLKARIADLKREEPKERDSRIFPGVYASVIAVENGKRIIRPMRYQCRPAGKPAFYDRQYPGTYNARRDNLEGFWKGQFGSTHALVVATKFYENVDDGEGGNQVLEYVPRTGDDMLIACLWSHWTDPKGKEPDLDSFAAITDEPEPEVAASGHDRTIINIKSEHVDAWLDPRGDRAAMQYIFDDKRHPYYEHRKAA